MTDFLETQLERKVHPAWDCHFPKIPLTQIEAAAPLSSHCARIGVSAECEDVGCVIYLNDCQAPPIHRSADPQSMAKVPLDDALPGP